MSWYSTVKIIFRFIQVTETFKTIIWARLALNLSSETTQAGLCHIVCHLGLFFAALLPCFLTVTRCNLGGTCFTDHALPPECWDYHHEPPSLLSCPCNHTLHYKVHAAHMCIVTTSNEVLKLNPQSSDLVTSVHNVLSTFTSVRY